MSQEDSLVNYILSQPRARRLKSTPGEQLVPEEFTPLLRESCKGDLTWLKKNEVFVPDANDPSYVDCLPPPKKKSLALIAKKLSRHALMNYLENVSEDRWEEDINAYVFARIRDDGRLRIEKRPYEYLSSNIDGGETITMKTPDQTFGLATYWNDISEAYLSKDLRMFFARGMDRYAGEVKLHNEQFKFHESLSKRRLDDMINDSRPGTGLIVDGKWGDTGLIFPWAVYEAKKTDSLDKAAQKQVLHAAQIYLGMLDDLARKPFDVDEYQCPQSSRLYQVFLFTSCGPVFTIRIAYNSLNRCMVDTIWTGDIRDETPAFELLCMMDQIQGHAVTRHREFVIGHLETWLQARETYNAIPEHPARLVNRMPRWGKLQNKTKSTRAENQKGTRARNLKRKKVEEEALITEEQSRVSKIARRDSGVGNSLAFLDELDSSDEPDSPDGLAELYSFSRNDLVDC
jgi:hypothetical protein